MFVKGKCEEYVEMCNTENREVNWKNSVDLLEKVLSIENLNKTDKQVKVNKWVSKIDWITVERHSHNWNETKMNWLNK